MKNIGTILFHVKLSQTDWRAERQLNLLRLAMVRAAIDAIKTDPELKGVDFATRGISVVQTLLK